MNGTAAPRTVAPVTTIASSPSAPTTAATIAAVTATAPAAVQPSRRPVPVGASAPVTVSPSPPVGLEIPTIGVSTPLQQLGLRADGTIAAPDRWDEAGWFAAGPEPGQPGPAVIAGHLDSRGGPAVFARLGTLRAGDEVDVKRADGRVLRFVVTGTGEYPKAAFPGTDVYGPTTGPALTLVTCGGTFDRATGHYLDNVVVSARLQDVR